MKKYKGFLPYDPKTDTAYINAIGENKTEASVNLDFCDPGDDVLKRIVFITIDIIAETKEVG